jgi:hypothetical protein
MLSHSEKTSEEADDREMVFDDQTGKSFLVIPEKWFDVVAAWISIIYSLATIALLTKLLLDTWREYYSWGFMETYKVLLEAPLFRLVIYTAIGGGIGAAVNNIRSFVQWHAERKAFGWRFVWKYISMPPLGATLAVMVYAILRGGVAVFDGGSGLTNLNATAAISAWATGALAGYGSHKVFVWLDDKVNSLFKVTGKVAVPDLSGKTREEAAQILQGSNLVLGDVSEKQTSDEQMIGKVIEQDPTAQTEAASGTKVAIVIGTAGPEENGAQEATVKIPDLSGKTRDEAAPILQAGNLVLGDVSEKQTSDGQMIGKVIEQDPQAGKETASGSKVAIVIGTGG